MKILLLTISLVLLPININALGCYSNEENEKEESWVLDNIKIERHEGIGATYEIEVPKKLKNKNISIENIYMRFGVASEPSGTVSLDYETTKNNTVKFFVSYVSEGFQSCIDLIYLNMVEGGDCGIEPQISVTYDKAEPNRTGNTVYCGFN